MKILILTAGYGAGHNSAARALFEEFERCNIPVHLEDGLALDSSFSYPASRSFYQFCVNSAGWLWGLTYELMDKMEWSRLVRTRFFASTERALVDLIDSRNPSLVICTYPLFNYILDHIKLQRNASFKHIAVVTDALEVSRPWVRSKAELILMTDEYSLNRISRRYALSQSVVKVSSFPTSARFYPARQLDIPKAHSLRVLYSAQAPLKQCEQELLALVDAYPEIKITVLAGKRFLGLSKVLTSHHFTILERSSEMDELMRNHHLYVGKPGGATVFECYATALPMVVNFALMGQEQGNLELLRLDKCGVFACGAVNLIQTVSDILANDALKWKRMRANMFRLPRRGGASKVRAYCEELMCN